MHEFTTGFNGDGTTELMQFACVMGVFLLIVIGWCAWYLNGD